MKLTLSETIEQFEDARAIQPINELDIYRKWIPILRMRYNEFLKDLKQPPNQVDSAGKLMDGEYKHTEDDFRILVRNGQVVMNTCR